MLSLHLAYCILAPSSLSLHTRIFSFVFHQYHLGQFRIVIDKRTPYEHDVRIPYYVRLPKRLVGSDQRSLIGSTSDAIVSNVDVAATLVELGVGLQALQAIPYDGESWAPLLGLQSPGVASTAPPASPRRTDQLIEYWGQSFTHYEPKPDNPKTDKFPPFWNGTQFATSIDDVDNTWSVC